MGFLCCALSACSAKHSEDRASDERHFFDSIIKHSPYREAWTKQTRTAHTYSSFDTTMRAEITHWNLDLREAYIEEMKRVYRLSEAEEQVLRMEQYKEDENYIVFVASISTRNPQENDFHRPNSAWRFLLESKEPPVQQRSRQIDLIPHTDKKSRHFFRNMNNFNQTYRVLFKRGAFAQSSEVELFLTGPSGRIQFTFQLQPENLTVPEPPRAAR